MKPDSDEAFREWTRHQPSCLDGRFSEYVNGEGMNPACHVRRAGDSGVAYKAEFSCVAMTQEQHLYQHQHGELACLRKYLPGFQRVRLFLYAATEEECARRAKNWFNERAAMSLAMWRSTLEMP